MLAFGHDEKLAGLVTLPWHDDQRKQLTLKPVSHQ